MGATVRFEGVSKLYSGFAAVRNLNLTVEPGEFVTLLGPSGSGKTTTLMMLAGFVPLTEGQIFVDSQPIAGLSPYQRGLGVVFQNYALFPHMTVAKNILFPLDMRYVDRNVSRRLLGQILSLVKLQGLENRYPHQLSGGQQQRVALARALVFKPSVLLMDEPLGALDKQLRDHVQVELKEIQSELGVTVISVTHDQEEAIKLSDRLVVMKDGEIQQVGSPQEVYEAPINRFVAGFLGDANFIDGRITSRFADRITLTHSNGNPITAVATESQAELTSVIAAIRPEQIDVSAASLDIAGGWKGVICRSVYLGDGTKHTINCDGVILTAKTKNNSSTAPFLPGDRVILSWRPENVRILPAASDNRGTL